jgi:glycosyltransferase involved in cell wall biosynthesis
MVAAGFDSHVSLLLDADEQQPDLPSANFRTALTRRRYRGQLAAYEEAAVLGFDLQRLKPDLYHAINLRLPGRAPCPLVVTLHDLIPWAWGGPHMRGERLRFWPGKKLLRRADAVLAVSQTTADDAIRFARVDPHRVKVVLEAANALYAPMEGAHERVKDRWGLAPGYLLFVGALDARKDPGALLIAWAAAQQDRPDLELVIAGDPGPQAPPRMPGARMVGRINEAELADLYTAAGCFVFPSRYEGFGLPCLEAMACGCPVAAYRNSSILEVVDGAGQLVDDGDAKALGHAAAAMAAEPDRWRKAGLRRARSFSWRKTAEQTIAAYESLLR